MSSTATYLSTSTLPVSVSISTAQMCAPNGNTRFSGSKNADPSSPRLHAVQEVVRAPRGGTRSRGSSWRRRAPPADGTPRPTTRPRSRGPRTRAPRSSGPSRGPGPRPARSRACRRPPRGSHACPPVRGDVGVTEEDLHVLHLDPELVGGDLRVDGLAALPVRRGARDHDDLPGGMTTDRGGLPAAARVLQDLADHLRRSPPAVLQVGGEADPDLPDVARVPTGLLLLPHLLVVEHLERGIERGRVVAGVDHQPADRLRGLRERRHEVHAADLDDVLAHAAGERVDHPLDRVRGLGRPAPR